MACNPRTMVEVDGVWSCRGCGMSPRRFDLPGNSGALFGPCNCEGWRAEQQPHLVMTLDKLIEDEERARRANA